MNFETIQLPALTIIGIELRTTYLNNECYSAIPAFWQQLYQKNTLAKIPSRTNSDVVLAIYTNYTPDFSLTSGYYSMIVGSPVTNTQTVPAGMVIKEIPAAKYAVVTTEPAAIADTWAKIWQTKNLKRTFTSDFEWYDAKQPNLVKIYVAIK